MEKEVIWTKRAHRDDLKTIYEFNIPIVEEEKAFELTSKLVDKADVLYADLIGSTRYVSLLFPKRDYQKLIWKN